MKQKTHARNNLIRKLIGTSWGADPNTVRTSALTLCYSAAEYAAPVWARSCHAKKVDIALNETSRIISGCLKSTPVEEILVLSGIAPSDIKREIASVIERHKQQNDPRHPLHGKNPAQSRLRSRKSFLTMIQPIRNPPEKERINRWKEREQKFTRELKKELPKGRNWKWEKWKALNRLRTEVGRCKTTLKKWKILREEDTTNYKCGETQTMGQLLQCL